jgi:hypothetical protein
MNTQTLETKPSQLPDISHAKPLTDADKPLIDELINVLRRHDALDRFGLTLLHQHFDISEDEVLLETTDRQSREQLIRPVWKSDLESVEYTETSWRLDTGRPMMACVCVYESDGKGGRTHTGHYSRGAFPPPRQQSVA